MQKNELKESKAAARLSRQKLMHVEKFKIGDIIISRSCIFAYRVVSFNYVIYKKKRVIEYAVLEDTKTKKLVRCTSGMITEQAAKFYISK